VKLEISLGSDQLLVEAETKFEKEYILKYFAHAKDETLEVQVGSDGCIYIRMCERARKGMDAVLSHPVPYQDICRES